MYSNTEYGNIMYTCKENVNVLLQLNVSIKYNYTENDTVMYNYRENVKCCIQLYTCTTLYGDQYPVEIFQNLTQNFHSIEYEKVYTIKLPTLLD